jgi:hypothetical protein
MATERTCGFAEYCASRTPFDQRPAIGHASVVGVNTVLATLGGRSHKAARQLRRVLLREKKTCEDSGGVCKTILLLCAPLKQEVTLVLWVGLVHGDCEALYANAHWTHIVRVKRRGRPKKIAGSRGGRPARAAGAAAGNGPMDSIGLCVCYCLWRCLNRHLSFQSSARGWGSIVLPLVPMRLSPPWFPLHRVGIGEYHRLLALVHCPLCVQG